MSIRAKHVGIAAGLLFGWAVVQYGFFRAVFIAVAGVVGWYIGRVLDGEIALPILPPGRDREELD